MGNFISKKYNQDTGASGGNPPSGEELIKADDEIVSGSEDPFAGLEEKTPVVEDDPFAGLEHQPVVPSVEPIVEEKVKNEKITKLKEMLGANEVDDDAFLDSIIETFDKKKKAEEKPPVDNGILEENERLRKQLVEKENNEFRTKLNANMQRSYGMTTEEVSEFSKLTESLDVVGNLEANKNTLKAIAEGIVAKRDSLTHPIIVEGKPKPPEKEVPRVEFKSLVSRV